MERPPGGMNDHSAERHGKRQHRTVAGESVELGSIVSMGTIDRGVWRRCASEDRSAHRCLCRNVIYMNCFMMERYLPGLLGLIYGDMTAIEAKRKVDGAHRTPAPSTPDISNET
jgi:hypothetical protein